MRPGCCRSFELTTRNGNLPVAVLFDLDDTILATSQGAADSWTVVAAGFAPIVSERVPGIVTPDGLCDAISEYRTWYWADQERNRVGRLNPREALRQNILGGLTKLGVTDAKGDGAKGLVADMAEAWTTVRWSTLKPFPGALETLRTLRVRGVRLGLLTNGSAETQRKKVDSLGLVDLIDHIQIEGVFGIGKPEPQAYLHALESLGVRPSQTWMVGDNLELDVGAPMKLGIHGIWVDVFGQGTPGDTGVKPDRVVRSIAELV